MSVYGLTTTMVISSPVSCSYNVMAWYDHLLNLFWKWEWMKIDLSLEYGKRKCYSPWISFSYLFSQHLQYPPFKGSSIFHQRTAIGNQNQKPNAFTYQHLTSCNIMRVCYVLYYMAQWHSVNFFPSSVICMRKGWHTGHRIGNRKTLRYCRK